MVRICENKKEIDFYQINLKIAKKLELLFTIDKGKNRHFAFSYYKDDKKLAILQLNDQNIEVKIKFLLKMMNFFIIIGNSHRFKQFTEEKPYF